MRLLAVNLAVGAFGTVQLALLQRKLDYKTPFRVGLVATVISGIVAIWMAARGGGVWSLAVQANLSTLISTALLWVCVPWRPRFVGSFVALRALFKFGSRLLAAGLLDTIAERGQLVLIGKLFSPADLGHYTRAYSTQQLPVGLMAAVLQKVTFPFFSSIADDRQALRAAAKKAIQRVMALTTPGLLGLAVIARPFILTVFGAQWLPCVPYLQVLCVAGVMWPVHLVNLSILMAAGRSDLFLKAEVAKKVVLLIALLASAPISVMAMVWARLAAGVIAAVVNVGYANVVIRYPLRAQAADLAKCGVCTTIMAAVVYSIQAWLPPNSFLSLIELTFAGLVVYSVASVVIRHGAVLDCFGFREFALGVLGIRGSLPR